MCSINESDIILNNIKKCLKETHKTQKELCESIGTKQQTFSEWNGGRSISFMKYLPQIAAFLGVSVDYLLGKTDQKETTTPSEQSLSLRDKYILSRFEGMSDEEVSKALDYLEKLKHQDN